MTLRAWETKVSCPVLPSSRLAQHFLSRCWLEIKAGKKGWGAIKKADLPATPWEDRFATHSSLQVGGVNKQQQSHVSEAQSQATWEDKT